MKSGESKARITRNPAVLGGKPIVRGTRISVELIYDWVMAGHTPDEIVDDYPGLTVADVEAAIAFAKAEQRRPEVPTR
jgi:uncharacterized protein (DUF433 family)